MKRIISLMLSLIIILSLVCGAVPAVSAASAMKTSDNGINMIKTFEGFVKYPQRDGEYWNVGYGTLIDESKVELYNDGITEAQAIELMKEYLVSFETSVNSFIDEHKLKLNQQQFDALISFTYNLGAKWMTEQGGTFRSAVINGKKGNDFIFAMAQFGKVNGSPRTGLIERRLCEANLYLNGVYGVTPPANFKYVVYYGNIDGVVPTVTIQGYNTAQNTAIKATVPSVPGYRFMGWYTQAEGGNWITKLNSNSAATTKLYAHWQNGEGPLNEDGTVKGTAASYSGYSVSGSAKTIYKTPGGEAVGTLKGNEKSTVTAEYVDSNNQKWGKISDGWINVTSGLASSPVFEDETAISPVTVTVMTGNVNNRVGPGTSYAKQGTFAKGQQLTITAIYEDDNHKWGKSDEGWIALEYTDYETSKLQGGSDADKVTAIGTIYRANVVNVRAGAGTQHAKVGTYRRNEQVKISLRQKVGNIEWGLTEKGWVSLYYVKLTEVTDSDMTLSGGTTGSTGTTTGGNGSASGETAISSGRVYNCNTLRIRAAAGTSNAHVGDYASGTYVDIYETTTVRSEIWGRTDKGWISLRYVKLDAPTTGAGVTGRIFRTATVNVRSGAGTHYPKVGQLTKGTKVEILEYVKVGNATWGRISQGWVSLYYVDLDTPLSNLDGAVSGGVGSAPAETTPEATEASTTKHNITVAESTNGKVTASATSAAKGDVITLTITPDANYALDTLVVKNAVGSAVTVTNGKFTMPQSNVTVTATFKADYKVNIQNVTGGKVTANTYACDAGTDIVLTATPKKGYILKSLTVVNTATNGNIDVFGGKFTMPAADANVVATFEKTDEKIYSLTVKNGSNGSVTVSTASALEGDKITLAVSPEAGYELDVLTVKKVSTNEVITTKAVSGAANSRSFTMPASDVTIAAYFKKAMFEVQIDNKTPDNGVVSVNPDKYEKDDVVTLNVTPKTEEYELKTLVVKAGDKEIKAKKSGQNYKFTMPAEKVVVESTFGRVMYDLNIEEVTGGTVTATKEQFAKGENVKLTVKLSTGYKLDKLEVTSGGNAITLSADNIFKMPNAAVNVKATFSKNQRALNINSNPGGTVAADKTTYGYEDDVMLTVTPNDGYTVSYVQAKVGTTALDVKVDASGKYTFKMPNDVPSVTVVFAKKEYKLTIATVEGGVVKADKEKCVSGTTVTLTPEAATGYYLKEIVLEQGSTSKKVEKDSSNKYTFEMPKGDATVKATFAKNQRALNINSNPGGTVVADKTTYGYGDDVKLTVTPNEGYVVDYVQAKAGATDLGAKLDASGKYTFEMPNDVPTVTVVFKAK